METKQSTYFKSLRKAISVLKCFTPENPELSGNDLASMLGMHKTTAYRMLATLAEENILERRESSGTYKIGPGLYVLGNLFLSTTDLIQAAEPVVKLANELTGEVTNLSIYFDGYISYVMREESKYEFRWGRHVGSYVPAHVSAMGKVFLSELSDSEIDVIYPDDNLTPFTSHTITSKIALKEKLEEIRKSGISVDYEGQTYGIAGFSAGIRDSRGKVIAAMSVGAHINRLNAGLVGHIVQLVKMSAALVSYRLGYRDINISTYEMEEIRHWWKRVSSNLKSNNSTSTN